MQVVCNPGIQRRHWESISEVIGSEVSPTEETPLHNLLDIGLNEFLPKLEEIATAAAKEHKLETALRRMKSDWTKMRFELLPYRDTVSSTSNLTSVSEWKGKPITRREG